jgi:predicted metal-dependent enzyme (double-stranded beta helix superfamily)
VPADLYRDVMVSPAPTIAPRDLAALDAPVRMLFERVAEAVPGEAPDMGSVAAAMIELAADHDYLAPRVRAFGDRPGAVGLHVPARGPRLSLVHRGEGQMGAIHDHGCWVAIASVTGIETHRHYRAGATAGQLARLELVTDRAVAPGEAVTMLTGDDIHAHGHVDGRGEAAYVLIMTGDDQRLYRRREWDTGTGRVRVLEPGDGGRWLESQPFPG